MAPAVPETTRDIGVTREELLVIAFRVCTEAAETGVYIQADLECDNAYAKVTATDQDGTEHVLTDPWGMRLNNGWTNTTRRVSGNDLVLTIEVVADGFVAIKDVRYGMA